MDARALRSSFVPPFQALAAKTSLWRRSSALEGLSYTQVDYATFEFKFEGRVPDQPPHTRYGWMPNSNVFHTRLCRVAVQASSRVRWRTGSILPAGSRECKHCKAGGSRLPRLGTSFESLGEDLCSTRRTPRGAASGTPAVIAGLALWNLACSHDMARQSSEPPEYAVLLGSYPDRLAPDLLVNVDDKVVDIFGTIAKHFDVSLGPGRAPSSSRQKCFFIRAAPGLGKTFLLHEMWRWWLQRRSPDAELQGVDVVFRELGRTANVLARQAELFTVTFNGCTCPTTTEMGWKAAGSANLFVNLRLCYAELVDPSISYVDFVDAVHGAIQSQMLTEGDIGAAAVAILKNRRGRLQSIPILLVDELSKVAPLYVNKLDNSTLGTYESAAAYVRSLCCVQLQTVGGTVLLTSLTEDLAAGETRSSGRKMEFACRTSYAASMAYRPAVEHGISPITKDQNVGYMTGKLLKVSADSSTSLPGGFVDALTRLLGGHGRFVNLTIRNLQALYEPWTLLPLVQYLTRREFKDWTAFSNTMSDIELEKLVGNAVAAAGESCNLAPLFDVLPGGLNSAKDIIAHVVLGVEVQPSDVVPGVPCSANGAFTTWDKVGADGIIGLPDSKNTKVLMVAWSLLCLQDRLKRNPDPFYTALRQLLLFPGERQTGGWLENFHLNWEVMISHARSLLPASYACVSIKKLLCSSAPGAYIGSSHLVNDVKVDASRARMMGVRPAVLDDLLRVEPNERGMLYDSVYKLSTSNSRPGTAVDAAVFFRLAQDFVHPHTKMVLAESTSLLVIYQIKDTSADSSVPSSAKDVTDNLSHIRSVVGEHHWEEWKDCIVYVLIDRRLGRLFLSNADSSVLFRESEMGKKCVLLTGDDLPGLFSTSLHDLLCAMEYMSDGVVSDPSVFIKTENKKV